MKFSELDIVRTKKDIPEEGVKKGDIGAIIIAFSKPNEAYEVEFVDKDNNSKQLVFLPDEIERVEET
ncbi:MAG TPA: DUF4926 domain-containing protein [Methanosarcina sp.]|uniref:DUF4926 domain-containing protein n=1 Tax=unclassified Methanosarcina TaxID=2644672 RepID=UPI000621580F|nr:MULTISPECIES: DUF4926 domain-containing protein [unclassified Methanosarcina]KKG08754.1 hypothetical protein EO92_13060 [Methanosarcina sp. 2.H.A.1B.4]KKH48401.1 hypothetical protein EO93_16945 [Methanosarcina sp. 1.H.A.2.2]HII80281.1 DUF4926 domain-containing protein [Methanosarcina sp.]